MAREIHHHRQLDHPNIVSLYEILTTETSIFIVSEHCPHGDLLDALTRKKSFSEGEAKTWFIQLVNAVQYCHSLGIIHRDLKLENILLDENDHVKICDFGFARQTDKNQMLKTFCGSLAYSAPEVIQRQNYCGPATDVWSLGVILYTLLAGELPFDDDCESVLQKKVVNVDYTIPDFFSVEVTDLLSKILKREQRITIGEILQHPWLKTNAVSTTTQLPIRNLYEEKQTVNHLIKAGFDSSVVEKMQRQERGVFGTLWTMLLSSHNCTTRQPEEPSWMGSVKSWFVSGNDKSSTVSQQSFGAIHQHKFLKKTMIAPPMINAQRHAHPAYNAILPLTPIIKKEEDEINTSSTCSSTTADDDFDDESSIDSSPATSVTEDEEEEEIVMKSNSTNGMAAFHRVSPMPSRVDIMIPRSRYNLDDHRTHTLRNRLESKMIIEEEEEEE
ncbi:unnamed protein product [Mucor hiemalis]